MFSPFVLNYYVIWGKEIMFAVCLTVNEKKVYSWIMMKSWYLTTCTSSKNGRLNYLIELTKVWKNLPPETLGYLNKIAIFLYLNFWCYAVVTLKWIQVLRCATKIFSEKHENHLRFVNLNFHMNLKSKWNWSLLLTIRAKTLLLGFLKIGSLPTIKCFHGMCLRKFINFSDAQLSEVQLTVRGSVED